MLINNRRIKYLQYIYFLLNTKSTANYQKTKYNNVHFTIDYGVSKTYGTCKSYHSSNMLISD